MSCYSAELPTYLFFGTLVHPYYVHVRAVNACTGSECSNETALMHRSVYELYQILLTSITDKVFTQNCVTIFETKQLTLFILLIFPYILTQQAWASPFRIARVHRSKF